MCRGKPVRSLEQPPFELRDIKNCIPPHLFKRSLVKSSLYLLWDLVAIAVLYFVAYNFIPKLPETAKLIAWPIWWYTIGAVMTGVWVVAHECGHQAFSDYGMVNDTVGWIFHSALLVPYFSWKYSHATHHAGTSDMGRDSVFMPPQCSQAGKTKIFQGNPIKVLAGVIFMVTLGWPSYLLANVTGQTYDEWVNHFNPYCAIFRPHQRLGVFLSDIGIAATISGLGYWAYKASLADVFFYYFVPYLIVNFWLVTITYLQHTHKDVPHYHPKDWTFVKGALATVDRDYGILNHVFHHITDSHVVHHLFSTVPHYHAIEATPYVKQFLGDYYRYESSYILPTLYNTWQSCAFVDDVTKEQDVYYYKHANMIKSE